MTIERQRPPDRLMLIAMLLNAIIVALALATSAWSGVREPVAGEREWRSPRLLPPDFNPFRDDNPFFSRPA